MQLFKAHSIGNKIIIIRKDNFESLSYDFICKLQNPFTGIGADQILAVDSNYNIKTWQENSITIKLCGHGLRCLGKLLNLPVVTVNTESGPVEIKNLDNGLVSLKFPHTHALQKFPDHYIVNIGELHKIFIVNSFEKLNLLEYVSTTHIISFLCKQNDQWKICTLKKGDTIESLPCSSASLAAAYVLHYLGYPDLTVHYKLGSISHISEFESLIQIASASIIAEIHLL